MPNIPNNQKQWDDIFYSGNFPQGSFSESDLNEMLQNFHNDFQKSKSKCILPLVKGHPIENNHPSFGWVDSVRLVNEGDKIKLQASYFDIDDKFKDDVNNGRYPNKSVRVGKTNEGWRLLHIGFLGATPPALNLPRTQFSKEENQAEEIKIIQFSIHQEVKNMQQEPKQHDASGQVNNDAISLLSQEKAALQAAKDELASLTTQFSDFQKKFSTLEEENKQQKQVIADFELLQKKDRAASLIKDFEFSTEQQQQAIDLILAMSNDQTDSLIGLLKSVTKKQEETTEFQNQYENMPFNVSDFAKTDTREPVFMTSLEKMMLQRKELANG